MESDRDEFTAILEGLMVSNSNPNMVLLIPKKRMCRNWEHVAPIHECCSPKFVNVSSLSLRNCVYFDVNHIVSL